MKLLFRRKSDGRILTPVRVTTNCVRLRNVHSDRQCLAKKDTLPERYEVLIHDIEHGDVLKDNQDGSMWAVLVTGPHDLRIRMLTSDTMKAITYFGLVNFTRVGRTYTRFQRRPDLAI